MKQNKDISPSPKKPGDEIKELMEQKGWQQQELANLLNLSLKHVNEILNEYLVRSSYNARENFR